MIKQLIDGKYVIWGENEEVVKIAAKEALEKRTREISDEMRYLKEEKENLEQVEEAVFDRKKTIEKLRGEILALKGWLKNHENA